MSGGGAGKKTGAEEELAGPRRKRQFPTLREGGVPETVTRNAL